MKVKFVDREVVCFPASDCSRSGIIKRVCCLKRTCSGIKPGLARYDYTR
jgi:hypothetical protein